VDDVLCVRVRGCQCDFERTGSRQVSDNFCEHGNNRKLYIHPGRGLNAVCVCVCVCVIIGYSLRYASGRDETELIGNKLENSKPTNIVPMCKPANHPTDPNSTLAAALGIQKSKYY